jgi:hypothetical protein
MRNRQAAIILAIALLMPAGPGLAGSLLSPSPPVELSPAAPGSALVAQTKSSTPALAATQVPSGSLPRTGMALSSLVAVAALLLATGTTIRLRALGCRQRA